jgi:DmsE family decaheme c-type cytochrome
VRATSWRVVVGLGVVLMACVSNWPTVPPQPYHRTTPIEGAELVGTDECLVCHEDIDGHAPAPAFHEDCEACHGSGSLHAESEEPADIRHPSDGDCLACHDSRRSHLAWTGADHARGDVSCSDCHQPHNQEPKQIRQVATGAALVRHAGATTQLCASCHVDVASRLELPSHHPISEGMLDCTDCHAPHASRVSQLGPPTEQCASCHQDVVGPWIFEHTPVAEDCGYCHAPHGAVAEALLETPQPGACVSCHTLAQLGATHDPSAYVSRCTDCHSAIHGSYTDPILRR